MGFSVSGATAVVLIGGLIAFGMAFSAANNGFERVSSAQEDREDRLLAQQNSAIEIANATYDAGATELTVAVNNTGSTSLAVPDTSLLVDGEFRDGATTSVGGDAATDVWLPGEQLTFTAGASTQPDRVKVIAETGISATDTEVTASG